MISLGTVPNVTKNMKRNMIMAGMLLMATICTAQTLSESDRTHHNAFSSVPKELTLDGKPYMAVVEYDFDSDKSSMGIYSSFGPNGAILKFDVPNNLSSATYYEKVTGYIENVVIKDKFYDFMGDQTSYKDSSLQAIEDGIKTAYGYPDWFHITEFTDPDGETGYYGNDYRRYSGDSTRFFYQYDKYGKMYPEEFFTLDTAGILRHCHFFHYEIEYDFDDATWAKDLDYTRKIWSDFDEYDCRVQDFVFQNLDKSFYPNTNIVLSQNIFNDDSAWEYVLADVDYHLEYGDAQKGYEDEIVRRPVYQTSIVKGFAIMNSDGDGLLYVHVPDKQGDHTLSADIRLVSIMDGVIYINTHDVVYHGFLDSIGYYGRRYDQYESMYAIKPNTTGIQSISRRVVSRMSIDATAVDKGNSLGIHVYEPAQGDNIVISSMSGQILNQTPLSNAEHISIETSAYPKGVYNVTLQGNSNPENQRIIIK